MRADGLEQSFVIHERPPAGDLVITGEVTTPLHFTAPEPRHGPVDLALADGRAVLSYGSAVAVDGNGVTTAITTATDGDRIVLRVAAETVATARFPASGAFAFRIDRASGAWVGVGVTRGASCCDGCTARGEVSSLRWC